MELMYIDTDMCAFKCGKIIHNKPIVQRTLKEYLNSLYGKEVGNMAVRTTAELMEMVRNRIGEDNSDEALTMLEDMTDSLSDYDRRIAESGDWERKYNENDEAWRKRYRERFENAPTVHDETTTVVDNTDPEVEPETFDDLFTTEV